MGEGCVFWVPGEDIGTEDKVEVEVGATGRNRGLVLRVGRQEHFKAAPKGFSRRRQTYMQLALVAAWLMPAVNLIRLDG